MEVVGAPGSRVMGDSSPLLPGDRIEPALPPPPTVDPEAVTWSVESAVRETDPTCAQILMLLTPGAPPRGWTARAAAILAGTLGCIVLLAAVGLAMRESAGAAFQEEQPGTWASAGLMLWSGALAAWAWAIAGPGTRRVFWATAALGMAILAIDHLFWIHERLDEAIHHMLGWNERHPVTDHLDDVIVLGYGLIAAAVLWRFRRELLDLPWFVFPLTAAACLFAAMVVLDVTGWGGLALEEGAKLLAAACIVCAMYAAVHDPEGLRRLRHGETHAP